MMLQTSLYTEEIAFFLRIHSYEEKPIEPSSKQLCMHEAMICQSEDLCAVFGAWQGGHRLGGRWDGICIWLLITSRKFKRRA